MPHSLHRKLRSPLIGLALVLLVLTAALNLNLNYRYAHVPLRSAIIPHPYPKMGQGVDGLAFSPDGKTLVAADTQTGMSFWDVPALRCRYRQEQIVGDRVSTVFWVLGTNMISLGDGYKTHRWNIQGGKLLETLGKPVPFRRTIPKAEYWNVFQIHVVSQSGKLAADADPIGDVVVWDTETGRRLFAQDAPPKGKYGYPISFCDIAFSPNDRFMAFASLAESYFPLVNASLEIVVRDVQTGKIVRQWQWKKAGLVNIGPEGSGGNLGATGLVFSSDCSKLAAADISHVTIWDVQSGQLRQTLAETGLREGGAKKLVFFGNGHLLASCGWKDLVPIWSVDTGNLVQTFHADNDTAAIAVSPNNKLLATGGQYGFDGRIELWNISRLRQ